jgi:predicted SprT family Zn-dependent metalloprotease
MNPEFVPYDTKSATPTAGNYASFNEAICFFNETLFGGQLPEPLFTMQRHRGAYGFFSSRRFTHRDGAVVIDEIALNPAAMQGRSDQQIASTISHEQAHQWQYHFGNPSRGGYHNREWATKMESIGLVPSHTGMPGGKRTGQKMSHYIAPAGLFQHHWQILADRGFRLDWQDRVTNGREAVKKLKATYACPKCSFHLWGQEGHHISCDDCGEAMVCREAGERSGLGEE